jgi:hypothetical protein
MEKHAILQPDIGQIEARMRPGALSVRGFLGPNESLRTVMEADFRALENARITFEALAVSLEALIAAASDSSTKEAVVGTHHVRVQQYLGFQICPWSPDPQHMQCMGRGVHFSSLDWRVENLRTCQVLEGPGLIVHLMHDHHFCEGRESPYRVDPLALAGLLGLV